MPGPDTRLPSIRDRAAKVLASVRARLPANRPSRRTLVRTGAVVGGMLVALILFLGLFDWNYLKGPVERIASSRTGRIVKIDGDLDVKILSWTPGADIHGLRVSNPAWVAGGGDMARIDRLQVKAKLMPLFRGRVVLPLLKVDNPQIALLREPSGRNNWTFKKRSKKPASLPPIQRFEINNGHLSINDRKRKLLFKGRVTSSEVQGGHSVQAFRLLGDGTLNGARFDMNLTGGPLLNVDPDRPYPFNALIRAGSTRVAAQGSIRKPFDLAVFDTSLAVSGSDMADLYFLTGLAFPNTPPYQVKGALARRQMIYTYNGLTGRVGDSDLRGDIAVDAGRDRPLMTADLKSRKLDFDDLAALLGAGASAKPGETASPEQAQIARTMAVNQRLFPDTPLRVERLRAMDARVKYSADTVSSERFPVRRASVDLTLDNGLLTMDPVMFGFPKGQLAGLVAINARQAMPQINMDVRLTGTRLEEFAPARFNGVVSGSLIGRAKLAGAGLSVRDFASHANGQVTLVVPSGQMRKGVAELMGVNVLNALFTDKRAQTELRCGVADFKVRDGIMTAETILLDTDPVLASGGGTINLKDERMALRVKGHPKEFRLLRLSLPLQLEGPIRSPKFGVEPGAAVGQAGIAAVVGTLLSPLAAILPFVSEGRADDANCQALIGRAGKPGPTQKTAEKAPLAKRG